MLIEGHQLIELQLLKKKRKKKRRRRRRRKTKMKIEKLPQSNSFQKKLRDERMKKNVRQVKSLSTHI